MWVGFSPSIEKEISLEVRLFISGKHFTKGQHFSCPAITFPSPSMPGDDDVRTLQVGLEKLGYTIPQHAIGA